jgi:hypothetical protein
VDRLLPVWNSVCRVPAEWAEATPFVQRPPGAEHVPLSLPFLSATGRNTTTWHYQTRILQDSGIGTGQNNDVMCQVLFCCRRSSGIDGDYGALEGVGGGGGVFKDSPWDTGHDEHWEQTSVHRPPLTLQACTPHGNAAASVALDRGQAAHRAPEPQR